MGYTFLYVITDMNFFKMCILVTERKKTKRIKIKIK